MDRMDKGKQNSEIREKEREEKKEERKNEGRIKDKG